MRYYESPQFDVKSLFVPDMTPWDQMIKMKEYEFAQGKELAEKKQAEHKANLANLDALNKGLVINAMPTKQDISKRNELLSNYKNEVSSVVDAFAANPEDPRIASGIAYLKNKWNTDLDRLTLEDNYKVYSENYLKDLSAANKEGAYIPELDPYREYAQGNEFGRWNYTGIENYLEPTETMNNLMKDIQPQLFSSIKSKTENGMVTIDKENTEKVTIPMIKNVAHKNLYNYVNSKPGRQQYKLYLNSFDGDQTKALAAMENNLFNIGYKQFRNNLKDKNISFHNLPENANDLPSFGGAYYGTPNTPIKGQDIDTNQFDLQKAGTVIDPDVPASYSPTTGAPVYTYKQQSEGFNTFNQLDEKGKKIALSTAKALSPTIYNKLISGQELDSNETAFLFSRSKEAANNLNQDKEYNSSVFTMSSKQANEIKNIMFGDKENNIENAAGNFINAKFWDKENGEEISGKQLKERYSEDKKTPVNINGVLDAKNPYVYLTDNSDYSNAYQVSIGGNEYIMTGPNYTDPIRKIEKSIKIANNSVYNVKINGGNPVDMTLNGVPVKITYDKNNKKPYVLKLGNNNNIYNFATPEEVRSEEHTSEL